MSRGGFLTRMAVTGVAATGASGILAACGGSGTTGAIGATETTGSAPVGNIASKYKNLTIGVPIYTLLDENQATIVKFLKEASERAGLNWKFETVDTKTDEATAQSAIDSFITRNVDAIIDITVPAAAIEAQLAKAKKAGIPTVGTYTFSTAESSLLADYSAPLDHDAVLLAHFLIEDQQFNLGNTTVKVGMLDVPLEVLEPRRWVFEAIAENSEGVEIVERDFNVSVTDTVTDATKRAQSMLRKNPDLTAIWCNYPPLGIPAASGVAQAGNSDVKVYGHNAQSGGVEALREESNPLRATSWTDFVYNSYGLVDILLEALSGSEPDKQISYLMPVPDVVFCAVNVESEVPKGTSAADWMFAGGSYRDQFASKWSEQYGS